MEADDDFDSNEEDLGPTPEDPYARAGQSTVAAILDRHTELRIQSKRTMKNLPAGGGSAPGTRRRRSQWANAWNAYYKTPDTVPTGEDLARFLAIVPSTIRSTYSTSASESVISWSTLHQAVNETLYVIKCRYDSFELTFGERERIKSLFRSLQADGTITKAPKYEPHWLSARTISRVTLALLQNAIQHGARNWSITIYKCLSMAIQSALGCRSGDIARTKGYDAAACILYEDVVLKVCINPQAQMNGPLLDRVIMKAKFNLKYTKGLKWDPSKNFEVTVDSLDPKHNCIDSLKLLLAHALRHGHIKDAVTPEQAIENALARSDNKIQWRFPKRPVLCSLSRRQLDLTTAAPAPQLTQTLNEAAVLAGIDQRVRSHDVRRGAASDATLVPTQRNMPAAGRALNHTHKATAAGITDKYVGHDTTSTLAERLTIPPEPFVIEHIDTTASTSVAAKWKRNSRKEIDDFLALPENAHLKRLKRPRSAAGLHLRKGKSKAHALSLREEQHRLTNSGGGVMPAVADDEDDDDDEDENIDPALLGASAIPSTDESMRTPAATQGMSNATEDLILDDALDSGPSQELPTLTQASSTY
ncbi:hypothetical protein LTR50_002965 [Elasticomyces elasticus]|nr:hypothetical protein LTR50_002965 [Elasticomyces elasticus]